MIRASLVAIAVLVGCKPMMDPGPPHAETGSATPVSRPIDAAAPDAMAVDASTDTALGDLAKLPDGSYTVVAYVIYNNAAACGPCPVTPPCPPRRPHQPQLPCPQPANCSPCPERGIDLSTTSTGWAGQPGVVHLFEGDARFAVGTRYRFTLKKSGLGGLEIVAGAAL